MKDEILNETTTHCETCPKKDSCPEEECVLYRIEQIVLKDANKNASNTKPFTCK